MCWKDLLCRWFWRTFSKRSLNSTGSFRMRGETKINIEQLLGSPWRGGRFLLCCNIFKRISRKGRVTGRSEWRREGRAEGGWEGQSKLALVEFSSLGSSPSELRKSLAPGWQPRWPRPNPPCWLSFLLTSRDSYTRELGSVQFNKNLYTCPACTDWADGKRITIEIGSKVTAPLLW